MAKLSRRTTWDTAETEWSRVLRERRLAGLPVLDLTASNPTRCGFEYDGEAILGALADAAALVYDPDPRGMLRAREAVCGYYADHGIGVKPEELLLTTSTSEAYSFLFRLLCDPGDEVLIASPSYPLFDFLAGLDDVRLVRYPLFYDYGWHLDFEGLRQRTTASTRAIVVVNPNNPTGHFTRLAERRQLEAICAEHGLALIIDEVFLDYSLDPSLEDCGRADSFAAGDHPVLTFVLSGISKVAALPQMKAAWVAAFGPGAEREVAAERLEVVADTFLSMNAPIQLALPAWLAGRRGVQRQILERVTANLDELDRQLRGQSLIARLAVEAGWYAVLRIPALEDDELTALRLLREQGIAVHVGHFFGFGRRGWLVLSLLTPLSQFADATASIVNHFNNLCGYS